MSDLHYVSATEALARFHARSLSPVELVQASIARTAAIGTAVNAFTRTFPDRALACARRAEARYVSGTARPLEGLPLAVKDLHPISGEITTHGSIVFRDNRDEMTLTIVERLLEAGAILFARTTSAELGLANVTHSRLWGVTRNPWNLAYTPGGSSGGAGAALAAGMVTLADGSDYGGSIRIPASCCGVVGYKPPRGRNPGDSLDPFSHFGPLARTVRDAIAMQNVMSGPSPSDPMSLPDRLAISDVPTSLAACRVAYSMDLGHKAIDPEVATATLDVLAQLRDLGCRVEEVALPWTDRIREAYEQHHAASDASASWMLLPTQRELLTDYALHQIERGMTVTGRAVFDTHEVRGEMYRLLGPILERVDLFVCPTTAVPALAADHSPLVETIEIAGVRVPGHRGWVLTYPFNMLPSLPVLSIPSGRSRTNVPMGVQLVGRPYDDAAVFRAALALETARGAWYDAPAHRPALTG
jgi:Asp-tRNA(Asn)/Glu-tRNA(Gln) amidotransferase A subunit family amidase